MAIDPDFLPARALDEVILTEHPCPKCGYELRGLKAGGVCPECGAAIRSPKAKRFADNLTDAPMWFLSRLAIGLGLMAGVVVLGVVMTAYSGLLAFQMRPLSWLAGGTVALTLSLAWLGGCYIAMTKRPVTTNMVRDAVLDTGPMRHAARATAAIPAVAVFAWALAVVTGHWSLSALAGLVTIAALFGLVPLCVYLSSLADWSGDTVTGDRLRGSAWVIVVCGGITLLAVGLVQLKLNIALVLFLFSGLTSLATLVAVVVLVACVVHLALTSLWAMQNSKSAADREIRMAERRRQADAEREAVRQAHIERAKAGRPDPRFTRPDPESEIPIPLAEGGPEADAEVDARLDAALDGAGDPTPADRRPQRVEPTSEGGYDLAPEDDGAVR